MKLSPELTQDLIEILNAQSKIKKIEDTKEYELKLKRILHLMNTKTGIDKTATGKKKGLERTYCTGGIQKEVYTANKTNKTLIQAAEAHLAAAEIKREKAKKSTKNSNPAPSLKEIAAKVVKYLDAKTLFHLEGSESIEKVEYRTLRNQVGRLLDLKTGGLSNSDDPSKSLGGVSAWKALKDFPGVEASCLAHQKALKNPPKVPYTPKEENLSLQQIAADIQETLQDSLEITLPDPERQPKHVPAPSQNENQKNPQKRGRQEKSSQNFSMEIPMD